MNQEIYQHIRSEDIQPLQIVLGQLEISGLESRLEGSAKAHNHYNDIDLLVATSIPDAPSKLYHAVAALELEHGAVIRGSQTQQAMSYLGGTIQDRYLVDLGSTRFDICYRPENPLPDSDAHTTRIGGFPTMPIPDIANPLTRI